MNVPGADGRNAEGGGELLEGGVAAGIAAFVWALELDVERARECLREPGGAVRVGDGEPVARAAGKADEAFGVLGDEHGGRSRREQVALPSLGPGAGVCVGEDPAEVLVAAAALAEERDMGAALERHLGAGDRAQAERFRGLGELERAVDAVVVGQRERVVAERDGTCGKLLGQRGSVQERVGRVRVQLDGPGCHRNRSWPGLLTGRNPYEHRGGDPASRRR